METKSFDIQYHTNIVFSVYFVKLKVQQNSVFKKYNNSASAQPIDRMTVVTVTG